MLEFHSSSMKSHQVRIKSFPGSVVVKNLPANAGDSRGEDLIPRSGGSLGVGNGKLLQFSCLENPLDRTGGLQSMRSQGVGHD